MAYASASPLQPHVPVNHSQPNLVERSMEPVSRGMVTKGQWEDLKTVILQMYIHEHKPFKQVVKILRDEYAFFPTENQFKKQINQWGFRKNFKEHELLEAIKGINSRENGQPEVKVGGFQVPGRRINRVLQKQAKLRAASQHLLSQDYEEMDMDQAGDNITNLSVPLVPVQDVQDVAA